MKRFQAKSKIQSFKITDLLFADDTALVAHSGQDLQHLIDNFSEASDIFGLKVSTSKTVTMCHEPETQPNITLKEERLTSVDNFCYLSSTISKGLDLTKEISHRIGKAAATYGKLESRVWKNRKLHLKTKMAVYNACILSSLLYGAETWITYAHQLKRLQSFHTRLLRKGIGIKWQDKGTNLEVLENSGQKCIDTSIGTKRLKWLGHIERMDDQCIPKQVLHG